MTNNQKTLNKSLEFEGVGLHTGDKVSMTIDPAKTNHGIKFQRLDLPGKPVIPADIDFVSDTKRSTTLEKDNVKVPSAPGGSAGRCEEPAAPATMVCWARAEPQV